METETKQKLNAPRKSKRASEKATNLLVIPKTGYIGKYYTMGITVEFTNSHAVVSRVGGITIYPTESVNYMMLRYIYELSKKDNRTEEEEEEFKGGDIFISSLTMTDFAGANATHTFDVYDFHLKHLIEETQTQIDALEANDEIQQTDDLNKVKNNFIDNITEIIKDAENE